MRARAAALSLMVATAPATAAAATPVHAQKQQVVAPQRVPGELFGMTLAADGDLAVIGAPGRAVVYHTAGLVHVLARTGDVWTVTGYLDEAASALPGRLMGRALAMRGGLLAVGAPGYNKDLGVAYLYAYDAVLGWQLGAAVSSPVAGARFGTAVAIAAGDGGDHALIGETVEALPAADMVTGKVHVFDRATGWAFKQTFTPQDIESGDRFGLALAAEGDRVIVGAPGKEGGRGAAYVFEREGGLWLQTDKLVIAGERVSGDFFGAAVAVSGDRALVGAHGRSGRQGAAYVFERGDDGWTQVQELTADLPSEAEMFGSAVSLRGDRALIAGRGFEMVPMVGSRGGGYLFARDDEGFRLLAALRADDGVPGDELGSSAALTDSEIFLGARFDDAPAQPAPDLSQAPGSAYLFGLTQAIGEPCARDLDCGDLVLCCDHACAAVDDCEPATQTGDGTTSSSTGGELPTTGDLATTSSGTTGGPGEPPAVQFEPGDAGCACASQASPSTMPRESILSMTMLLIVMAMSPRPRSGGRRRGSTTRPGP